MYNSPREGEPWSNKWKYTNDETTWSVFYFTFFIYFFGIRYTYSTFTFWKVEYSYSSQEVMSAAVEGFICKKQLVPS